MATQPVSFHCPCLDGFNPTRPPPSNPPLSTLRHHPLASLLFCEECDAVRCDVCATGEPSCYYCPNCLFEVPSASVRGEKNRCARNCFQCPLCCHTLAVVLTDPNNPGVPLTSAAASVGEPPYYLYCSYCRWDSKSVGISFEKPTGLSCPTAQLQKGDDQAPELLEFDRLKEHIEPYLRRGQTAAIGPTASASTRYLGMTSRSRNAESRGVRDELDKYAPLSLANKKEGAKVKGKERMREEVEREDPVEVMRKMKDWQEVACLDKRWNSSWNAPLKSSDLRPLRIPLQAKRTKRCPECKHILIKPEQKSSSTRYKIKLVASNYLPAIELYRRPPATLGSRLSAIGAGTRSRNAGSTRRLELAGSESTTVNPDEPLRQGRTYSFELSFTNPLYEPIHVKLAVARPNAQSTSTAGAPPYAVHLPSPHFAVSAYAEEWEYEEEQDEEDTDDGNVDSIGGSPRKRKSKHGAGIVERKMNRTTVLMEVAVAKDAVGPLRANMLVTYVYQADTDDGTVPPSPSKSPSKTRLDATKEDVKSFSFWTLFTLGTVVPRSTATPTGSTMDSSRRRENSSSGVPAISAT